jgi:hypothetical protein
MRALLLALLLLARPALGAVQGVPVQDGSGNVIDPSKQGAPNTVANGWPVKTTDGTNTVTIKAAGVGATGSDTAEVVDIRQPTIATYTYTATFTAAATPTDIFVVGGSGTKTIRVQKVCFSATQTTAGMMSFFLIKRSSADTAGTSGTVASIPHDSNSAAATASVLQYTANPTLGGTVGTVRRSLVMVPATTTALHDGEFCWDFSLSNYTQGVVLRGTAQQLAVNLGGATLPTGFALQYVTATITEE